MDYGCGRIIDVEECAPTLVGAFLFLGHEIKVPPFSKTLGHDVWAAEPAFGAVVGVWATAVAGGLLIG